MTISAEGRIRGLDLPQFSEWVRRNDPCVYCGKTAKQAGQKAGRHTFDHIVPESRGGKRSGNLAPACQRCNLKKADRSVLLFLLEQKHQNIRQGDWVSDCKCRQCTGRLRAHEWRRRNGRRLAVKLGDLAQLWNAERTA